MMNLMDDDKSDGNEFTSLSIDYQHQQEQQQYNHHHDNSLIALPSKSSNTSRLFYSLHINNITLFNITGKNTIQSIILKTVNSYDYGYPKLKHLNIIKEYITNDINKFEEILIIFNALTNWKDNKIVSCKILIVILILMQRSNISFINSSVYSSLNHYLILMKDYWFPADKFLYLFCLILHQRLLFLYDNYEYNEHFNISKMSYNGSCLPSFNSASILSILSRLLSIQNNLICILNFTTKLNFLHQHNSSNSNNGNNNSNSNGNNDANNLTRKEIITYQSSLTNLFEEANCIYIANYHIFLYIYNIQNHNDNNNNNNANNDNDNSFSTTNITVITLREQFDEQFLNLRFIYCDLMNTDVNNKQYLGRFPESNPLLLLQQQKKK
jgi:hypothetical protein